MQLHLLPIEIQKKLASFLEYKDIISLSLTSKIRNKSIKYSGLPYIEYNKKMILSDFLKKNPDANSLLNSWNKFKLPIKEIDMWYVSGVLKNSTVFMRANDESHYILSKEITDRYADISILNRLNQASPLEKITIINENLKVIRSTIINTKDVINACVIAFNRYFRGERTFHELENSHLNYFVKFLVYFVAAMGIAVIEERINHNDSIFNGLKVLFAAGLIEFVRRKTVDLADPNNQRLVEAFTNLAPSFVLADPDKLTKKFSKLKARFDRLG